MAEGMCLVKELSLCEHCGARLNFSCQFLSVLLVNSFQQALSRMLLAISILDLLRTEIDSGALVFMPKSKWMILKNLFHICQAVYPDIFW